MIKHCELSDPTSCLNRARPEEMVFVLLGRDITTPETIRFWCKERIRRGKNKPDDPQIVNALNDADYIERKQAASEVIP